MNPRHFVRANGKPGALAAVPAFSTWPADELAILADLFDEIEVDEGHILARRGWIGSEFFVIAEGVATVVGSPEWIGSLGSGAFFGEGALAGLPRETTVVADGPMRLLVLCSDRYERLMREAPVLARRLIEAVEGPVRRTT